MVEEKPSILVGVPSAIETPIIALMADVNSIVIHGSMPPINLNESSSQFLWTTVWFVGALHSTSALYTNTTFLTLSDPNKFTMSANNQISSAFGKLLEAIDGKLDQAYWFVVWDSKLTKNSKQQYRHYTNSLSSHRQNLLMLSSLVSLQAAREWQKDGISFLPCSTSRRSL